MCNLEGLISFKLLQALQNNDTILRNVIFLGIGLVCL
jgi:hypothetical protein